ncbi:unnamed protein product, partial [marine sediment metagenome]
KEHQEKRVAAAFERLRFERWQYNQRLIAALGYFHTACRLIAAGNSPWEFMAEAILNLSKVLEILFVKSDKSMDDVREGLKDLGYSIDDIERDFIPIMVLRSYFDVAHPSISLFDPKELQVMYKYLADVEHRFRDLLKGIIDGVCGGTYTVLEDPDLTPDQDKRDKMVELISKLKEKTGNKKRSNLPKSK